MSAYNNFCPVISAFSNRDCTETSNSGSQFDIILGNVFVSDSRCYYSTALSAQYYGISMSGDSNRRCHRTVCLRSGGVQVFIGTNSKNYIVCPSGGGNLNIYKELKKRKLSCVDNGNGNCADFFGVISCIPASRICFQENKSMEEVEGEGDPGIPEAEFVD
eukprot:c15191_g1_i1.p1 GENE.c15191_g1_i1~~c15191_g1_i1.p1  ORF type:complete len:161 (-),score=28.75 c15191_g1_i1:65-547(-)